MKTRARKTAAKGKQPGMRTSARKTAAKARGSTSRLKLKDIMTPDVVVVSPNDTLQIAARKMQEWDIGFLPVCDGERLVGTLSDRDIAIRAVAAGFDPRSTPIKDFATSEVVWCFDDESVDEAARKMQDKQIRRMVVIGRGDRKLVGVISLGDLAADGTQKISSEVLQSVSPAAE